MRYAEIICEQAVLEEGFLDTLTKAVASMATRPFQAVTNAASALVVIKNVIADAKQCETTCFLLRKQIIRFIQPFPKVIADTLWKVVPKGYTVLDFLGMIILLPAATHIANQIRGLVGDTISDTLQNLVDKLTNLKAICANVLGAGAQGIFAAFKMLGLADELLFQTLDSINSKMKAVQVQPAQGA